MIDNSRSWQLISADRQQYEVGRNLEVGAGQLGQVAVAVFVVQQRRPLGAGELEHPALLAAYVGI